MNDKTSAVKSEIENFIENVSLCRFDRKRIASNAFDGFPLKISGELCLFSTIHDFLQDGYVIVRLKDLTSVRVSDVEQFQQSLIKNQGLVDEKVCYNSPLKEVENLHEVLKAFAAKDEIIIVESEKKEEFYIGKVKKVTKSHILFHHFDALGNWEESYEKINIDSITLITIKSRYINAYVNYFRKEEGGHLINGDREV